MKKNKDIKYIFCPKNDSDIKSAIDIVNQGKQLSIELTENMLKSTACFIMAKYNGKVVGVSALKENKPLSEIGYTGVLKAYRRQGIASEMTKRLIFQAKGMGIHIIYAAILINNFTNKKRLEKIGFIYFEDRNSIYNENKISLYYYPVDIDKGDAGSLFRSYKENRKSYYLYEQDEESLSFRELLVKAFFSEESKGGVKRKAKSKNEAKVVGSINEVLDLQLEFDHLLPMFDQWVKNTPSFIALEWDDFKVSYLELDRYSNQVANGLLYSQVERGDVVVLLYENPIYIIVSLLAVLKVGGIYTIFDNKAPVDRLVSYANTIKPTIWLSEQSESSLILEICGKDNDFPKKILFSDFGAFHYKFDYNWFVVQTSTMSAEKVDFPVNGEDPAYIVFTSGSTGIPKPVVGCAKSLAQYMIWEIDNFDILPQTRISQLSSYFFDVFSRDVFVPLCSGGTLCIPPNHEIFIDPNELLSWLDISRVEVVHCVPTLFRILLSANFSGVDLLSLNYILMSGEELLPADVDSWYKVMPYSTTQLVNIYGPTETCMAETCYLVKEKDRFADFIPIGKPILGVQIFLINKNGWLCKAGEEGEIVIRSNYLTFGYYLQVENTSKVFCYNPFIKDMNDRFYRTGDLALLLGDGNYRFLGRCDRQVKINGVRLELGEIENELLMIENVSQAVVELSEDGSDKYLYACYVLKNKNIFFDVRGFLQKRLPSELIPKRLYEMDFIPCTSSGKVDVGELNKKIIANNAKVKIEQSDKNLNLWSEKLRSMAGQESFDRDRGDVCANWAGSDFIKINKELKSMIDKYCIRKNIMSLSVFVSVINIIFLRVFSIKNNIVFVFKGDNDFEGVSHSPMVSPFDLDLNCNIYRLLEMSQNNIGFSLKHNEISYKDFFSMLNDRELFFNKIFFRFKVGRVDRKEDNNFDFNGFVDVFDEGRSKILFNVIEDDGELTFFLRSKFFDSNELNGFVGLFFSVIEQVLYSDESLLGDIVIPDDFSEKFCK